MWRDLGAPVLLWGEPGMMVSALGVDVISTVTFSGAVIPP